MTRTAEIYLAHCRQRIELPNAESLAAFEERIGSELPWEFRKYVLEFNGGLFDEPSITLPSSKKPFDRLSTLYGVGARSRELQIDSEANLGTFDDNDPVSILPIGYTLMGKLLCMFVGEEEHGWIAAKYPSEDRWEILGESIDEFFDCIVL